MKKLNKGIIIVLLCTLLCGQIGYKGYAQPAYDNQGVYDFVVRLYQVVLEREPDTQGLDDWYGLLVNGSQSGAQVARDFLFSDEFIQKQYSNEKYLQILYRALFGREADETGYSQWLDQLNAGASRLTICKGFVDSDEFAALCASFGIIKGTIDAPQNGQQIYLVDQFVRRLYQVALGREADGPGLESWKKLLLEGSSSGAEVVQGFIFSQECQNKNLSDSEFVDLLYAALFDRGADPSGKDSWLGLLTKGLTRNYVCCGFINSQEFSSLCERYGIARGSAVSTNIRDTNETLTIWIYEMYMGALGRPCSVLEQENALRLLMNRSISGNNFVKSVFLSAEYQAKQTSNETFLQTVYNLVLRKNTSESDYSSLLNQLNNGAGRDQILNECFRMQEFSDYCNLLGILCEGVQINIPDSGPLQVFNSWNSISPQALNRIQSAVSGFTSRGYDVGFVLVDLNTGQGISYNNNKEFYCASTIKGPYVVCLNEMIPSSSATWGSVMRQTIAVSSNSGYASLRANFGSTQFRQWLNDAGCTGVDASRNYPGLTPKELALMWMKSYDFFTSGQQNSQWCAQLFTNTLNSSILNTMGSTYTTYSKAGWISSGSYMTVQNDAGIVMKTGHPYVIVIMSSAYGRLNLLNDLVLALDSVHSELVG